VANDILYELVRTQSYSADFTVLRNGQKVQLPGVQFDTWQDEKGETHMSIGFSVYGLEKTTGNVLREAGNSVLYYGRIVFTSLVDLVRGRESINNLSGPVGIVTAIGQAANYGWQDLLEMLALITELVDIRKADLGIGSLNLKRLNMSQMVARLFDEISSWAENKRLAASYTAEAEDIVLDADKDKIGKMVINLLSNAIKYTNEGGQIEVSFKRGTMKDIVPRYETVHTEGSIPAEQPVCILTVKDTGVGISTESIRLIYERFFQTKGTSQSHLGSGIGLAIVKSIVLQHKGVIVVSSERMTGTEFIVALPIFNRCTETENDVPDIEAFINEQYNERSADETRKEETPKEQDTDNPQLPTLLLVEDNKELQAALKEQLSPSYNIRIADNGRIGLEMCMSIFPDIIVSDVMMPEMNGLELCSK